MITLFFVILWSYALLGSFLIYTQVHAKWVYLEPVLRIILLPFMLLWFVDVGFNLVIGSILFMEPPRQLTLTQRCDSHLHDKGFRGSIARALCNHILNVFEPGHCR